MLVGCFVTVVLNGKTIIVGKGIPGITRGALDSNEAEPGPIFLQGDHGKIFYRNPILKPAIQAPGSHQRDIGNSTASKGPALTTSSPTKVRSRTQ